MHSPQPVFSSLKVYMLSCLIGLFSIPGLGQVPTISSLNPQSGPVGITVTITGSNFSTMQANNIVYFGAVKAVITSATANSLRVTVPAGATFEPVSVTVNNLTAYSTQPFLPTFFGGGTITSNSFGGRLDSTTGLHPFGLVIVDLDGDRKPDMATVNNANTPSGTVAVHRNTSEYGSISFSKASFFPAPPGGSANSIVAGDIDGDGQKDLITTSTVSNVLSVYRNTSTTAGISMATRIDVATGESPNAVVVGDFDKDGKPDLALVNTFSNSISVYRNTSSPGNVSFAARVDLPTGLSPHAVAIADLDMDGLPDLAVTNFLSRSISLYRNVSSTGTLSFAPKIDVTLTGNDQPVGIAIGDVNGDGKPDLTVTNDNYNQVTEATVSLLVLKNNSSTGALAFGNQQNYGTGDAPHVCIGDMNGDGKPEVITSTRDYIKVFENTSASGNISLATAVTYPAHGAYRVVAGDLDGDWRPDLAVANAVGQQVYVFRNKTTEPAINIFTPTSANPGTQITINGENFTGTTAVTLGGQPVSSFTVVNASTITATVGSGASGNVAVTTPRGTAIAQGFTFIPDATITSFVPAEGGSGTVIAIIGNGFVNVSKVSFGDVPATSFTVHSPTSISAVIGSGASGNVLITTATGSAQLAGFTFVPAPVMASFTPTHGSFGTPVTITGTNLSKVTAVSFGGVQAESFTHVNANTITAIVGSGVTGSVSVSSPGGNSSLPDFVFQPHTISSFTPATGPAGSTVVINGTGFSQVLSENIVHFGGVKAVVKAASSSSITAIVPAGATWQPISVTIKGLIAASSKPFTITFAAGPLVSGSYHQVLDSATGLLPVKVAIADFDGDGKPDIAQSAMDEYSLTKHFVSIFTNTSSGNSISLSSPALFTTGRYPIGMAVGDINGDGKPDIMTAHFNAGSVGVLTNTSQPGSPMFAPRVDIPVPGNPVDVQAADVDGDGRKDLIVISQPTNIYVFRNIGVNGNTAFDPGVRIETSTGPYSSFISLALEDIDGDGKPEIAIADGRGQMIILLKNNSTQGKASFATALNLPTTGNPSSVTFGDVDGDNMPDLLTQVSNSIFISKNRSNSAAISFIGWILAGHSYNFALHDVSGDGYADLVLPTGILTNLGSPGIVSFSLPIPFADSYSMDNVNIADLDGDGKPDLAASVAGTRSLTIIRNRSGEGYIDYFYPAKAIKGQQITIKGRNFTGATSVKFGGVEAASYTVLDSANIKAVLGEGASGIVSVTIPAGVLTLPGFTFIEPVSITAFTPAGSAGPDQIITITGSSVGEATAVSFGGVAAQSFTVLSTNAILAKTGAGASGDVVVTTPFGTAKAPGFTYVPTPYITGSTSPMFCEGDSVVIRSSADMGNQWYKNDVAIPGATNKTLIAKESGRYSVVVTISGIASQVGGTVVVTVKPVPPKPTITWNSGAGFLVSSASSGNQWYIDTVTAIPGATGSNYAPTAAGLYSVKVTLNNGCPAIFSDRLNFTITATVDLGSGRFLKLFPNPVEDNLVISYQIPGINTLQIDIVDMNGRKLLANFPVRNGRRIDMSGYKAAMYMVRVYSTNGKVNYTIPVLKL